MLPFPLVKEPALPWRAPNAALMAPRFRCFSDLGKAEMTEVFLDTWPDGVEGKPAARPWCRMLCVGLTPWRRLEEMAAFSWRRLAAQNPKQRSARQGTWSSATSVVRVKLCFRTVTRARLRLMEPCVSSYVPKISMTLMLTVVSRLTILPSSKFFVGKLDLNWRAGWLVNEEGTTSSMPTPSSRGLLRRSLSWSMVFNRIGTQSCGTVDRLDVSSLASLTRSISLPTAGMLAVSSESSSFARRMAPLAWYWIAGPQIGLVGKLNSLLSRHQKISAKEEADYQQTAADLDAQIIETRAQQPAALKDHQEQTAANYDLLVGLRSKLDSLGPNHPKTAELDKQAADDALRDELNLRFNAQFLNSFGLAGLSEHVIKAIVAATLAAQKEASARPSPFKKFEPRASYGGERSFGGVLVLSGSSRR